MRLVGEKVEERGIPGEAKMQKTVLIHFTNELKTLSSEDQVGKCAVEKFMEKRMVVL